jgi:hypothetical protein
MAVVYADCIVTSMFAVVWVYFKLGANAHVPSTAHEIILCVQPICAVPGTLCPERELHPVRTQIISIALYTASRLPT